MSYARTAVTRMTLDMSRLDLQRSETVTQGDTNRRWEVTLINGGAPFRLPPNWTAALTGIKPDGTGLLNGCSVVDGKIVYDFAAGKEIATCVGGYPVQFDIWDEVGELVASPKVYVNVLDDVRPHEELKSDGQYTQIGNLIGKVNQIDADVDRLAEKMLTQGDDITALKEKVTTAGTVTIPASEWTDTLPKLAFPEQPVIAKGTVALLMPGNTASQIAARKAKITVQSDPYGDGKIVVQREDGDAPTGNITLDYLIIKVDNPEAPPKAALIGVDAYGEGGGAASGVDETAVKALINKEVPEWARAKQKPTYTPEEVKARPATWTPTAEEIGARPSTWMPTAAEVGARPNTWTPTAGEVGAESVGKVKDHNEDSGSHTDIRLDITTIRTMLNTVIGTDTGKSMRAVAALVVAEIVGDASDSFDTLEEIAAWIEAHPNDVAAMVKRITDLETAMGGKVSKADIINTLDSTALDKPLSAAMGAKLNAMLTEISDELDGKTTPEQVAKAISDALTGYALKDHNHDGTYAKPSDIPTVPQTLPNPYALTILGKTYTGGKAVSLTAEEIMEAIKTASGGVVAYLDGNRLVLSGNLPDATYTAYYEVNGELIEIGDLTLGSITPDPVTYTIKWVNYDGEVLKTVTVAEGDSEPEYDGLTPTRAEDGQYTYTFKGWDKTVDDATGDVTYTATYTQTAKPSEPTYTNRFTAETALLNTRIAGTGELKKDEKATGKVTTDFITIPTDKLPFSASTKIYIKGATFTADGNTKIATYQAATGTDYSAMYSGLNGSSISTVDEGNGVISVSGLTNSFPASVKRMALTLKVKDTAITADDVAGIVITIGEPIS